jgi:hypothetical protein
MPRDEDWIAKRERAKILVRVLAKFERNFNDPRRPEEALNSGELQTLDICADEAFALLGDKTLVSPMITGLKALLFYAEREDKPLSFDAAYRYLGPILAAVEAVYNLAGSSGCRSITSSGKNLPIVVQIDEES